MAKASPMQTNFTAGIYSDYMYGHVDAPRRNNAVAKILNLIPLIQGPLIRRGGTAMVSELKDSAKRSKLLDFQFNVEQAYMIEFGDQYMRFYKDHGVITEADKVITGATAANPVVVTSVAHGFSNGDTVIIRDVVGMEELNGDRYTVANVATDTFELAGVDGSAFTAYTSGGVAAKIFEIVTPYLQADLFNSDGIFLPQKVQSADVMYIVHENYKPRSLARYGDADWVISEIDFEDGPYIDTNTTATTLTTSGTTGVMTVTASSTVGINGGDGFVATDVGRHIRIKENGNWHWGYITAYTSSTEVSFGIQETAFSTGGAETTDWRLGLYSETTGWPSAITFYDGRVALASSPNYRQRVAMTTTGGFSPTVLRFSPTDFDATVNPDNAISVTIGTTNWIRWLAGDEKGLVVGTAGGEFIIRPSVNGESLSPDNSSGKPTSKEGVAPIQPIETGSSILFVQRYRRTVNEHAYNIQVDGYRAPDMNLFAHDILNVGAEAQAYQAKPNRMAWYACSDGGLRALTYRREEEVIGWSEHEIGGFSDAEQTKRSNTLDVAVIPAPSGAGDELWLIVERYINGATKQYIEYMTPYYNKVDMPDRSDAFQVDCGLTYEGVAASVISGLDHLEGQEVAVMVDGRSHPNLTVANGSITLANGVTGEKVHVGLSNRWRLETLEIEAGARDGVAQGKIKRFSKVLIRLLDTLGLKYGSDEMDEHVFENGTAFNQENKLYSGDIELTWPNGYEREGRMCFEDDGVFPVMIQALMPRVRTQDG